ncbi:unnamed protein product [Protopolystoma xenopodis]|uniref:Uncharacterized protein n=1 Tax=Protopolystoma xenopodis TaxID=117903 RepID=A0A3S5BG31_9PLAT|nr:unnamed protein product [Protopolystoma xenopodis]
MNINYSIWHPSSFGLTALVGISGPEVCIGRHLWAYSGSNYAERLSHASTGSKGFNFCGCLGVLTTAEWARNGKSLLFVGLHEDQPSLPRRCPGDTGAK